MKTWVLVLMLQTPTYLTPPLTYNQCMAELKKAAAANPHQTYQYRCELQIPR